MVSRRAQSLFLPTSLGYIFDDIRMFCLLGHLRILKLYSIKYVIHGENPIALFSNAAARGGHLNPRGDPLAKQVMKWLRRQGCPFGLLTCEEAAKHGHYKFVKWAINNGAKCDYDTFSNVAFRGDLKMLQYLFRNQKVHPEPFGAFKGAVKGGHIKCLIWLQSMLEEQEMNSSFWAEDATKYKQLETLKWLIKHNYRWDKEWCLFEAQSNPDPDSELIKWILSQPG